MTEQQEKPPLPPFTLETALQKVQVAENAWNTKDPEKVCLGYTIDTEWRNRAEFISGREEVKKFLYRKWAKELDYRLKKELWGFRENRMAVRSNMNGRMIRATGSAAMVTSCGSSMRVAS